MNQILQRISSIFLYTYPLKASINFGDPLSSKYFLKAITYYLTFPINFIEDIFEYSGLKGFSDLLIFLLFFVVVIRNTRIPYFVRYNACQALLLKIALTIIIYSFSILSIPFKELISFVFVLSFSIFIFSAFQCINGVEPEIPFISKSVRMQI